MNATEGCDASLLLDSMSTIDSENNSRANKNSARGFEVMINQIKIEVDKICGRPIFFCADILADAARDSIVEEGLHGWCHWEEGTQPATASRTQADRDIPSPFMDLPALIENFKRQGLDDRDLVVLSPLGWSHSRFQTMHRIQRPHLQ
ncbi:hypothetical protein QYF36_004944 [Acer negundo]|nr:hypothetical protein QYF36_004944 [Acer negundo]